MHNYQLSQINIYPVKSLPGISLNESEVEERGIRFDRRWMLVDNENKFITQRLFPQMIFIDVKINNSCLIFNHIRRALEPLLIPLDNFPDKKITVNIWEDTCIAVEYDNDVHNWFSSAINFKCKLVYMPNSTERKTSTKYYHKSKNVSFADGYPFLIIGEESLNHLNSKLKVPVLMEQFRPNFVFSGGKAHVEDYWNEIKIGNLNFNVIKPCARCVITTIDPKSGIKNKEPLATLAEYRNFNNKVMFGQNMVSQTEGIVKVGDKIIVR
jgi:hypothetical protein